MRGLVFLFILINLLLSALSPASANKDQSSAYKSTALTHRGISYFVNQKYHKALEDFNASIRMNPSDHRAYYYRGRTNLGLSRFDDAINDFSKTLESRPRMAVAYTGRGLAYAGKYQTERALADLNKGINLPGHSTLDYAFRAYAYTIFGSYDKALVDTETIISREPNSFLGYLLRSFVYTQQSRFEEAHNDHNRVFSLNTTTAEPYYFRGYTYLKQKQYRKAVADLSTAIKLGPHLVEARSYRARANALMGRYDLALKDLDEAIQLNPYEPISVYYRAFVFEKQGRKQKAIVEYNRALSMPQSAFHKVEKEKAKAALQRLQSGAVVAAKKDVPAIANKTEPKPKKASGRRIALVIGNGKYTHASKLVNPHNDARAFAAALRRLGFVEVIELYDLSYSQVRSELKKFGDKAATANWAVIYYAGHGVQVDGKNYIIPTDAKLRRVSHIEDEAVSLNTVLSKVSEAKQLRMVILDACRNNPFASRMFIGSGRTRSIGKGLAPIEPDRGTLVAYSARDGQVALDGEGQNSPYTKALLQHIETEGLEINLLFRKVRDTVLRNTSSKQEPYVYGSLPGIELFFKQ